MTKPATSGGSLSGGGSTVASSSADGGGARGGGGGGYSLQTSSSKSKMVKVEEIQGGPVYPVDRWVGMKLDLFILRLITLGGGGKVVPLKLPETDKMKVKASYITRRLQSSLFLLFSFA